VAVFLPMPSEPPIDGLIDALRHEGRELLAPRVEGGALLWCPLGDAVAESALGIREPIGIAATEGLATCAAVLVPALAVDLRGNRLGFGGGYYDRALAQCAPHRARGPKRIAVVFDDEVVDSLPAEPHDQRVDAVLTDRRYLEFD
jgi:5-formyltetrahydrofolate cyclo-ligase